MSRYSLGEYPNISKSTLYCWWSPSTIHLSSCGIRNRCFPRTSALLLSDLAQAKIILVKLNTWEKYFFVNSAVVGPLWWFFCTCAIQRHDHKADYQEILWSLSGTSECQNLTLWLKFQLTSSSNVTLARWLMYLKLARISAEASYNYGKYMSWYMFFLILHVCMFFFTL